MDDKDIQGIMQKYRRRLNEELDGTAGGGQVGSVDEESSNINSIEYEKFKKEVMPAHFSLYEKMCNLSGKLLKISPDSKKAAILQESINTAHLNATPAGTTSLSILAPLAFILVGLLLSVMVPALYGNGPSMFFIIFFLLAGLGIMVPFQRLPEFLANSWRLRASNQMVISVFYIVTYMRHTSNLELAIEFACNHLSGPLSLDLRKVLWDIETEKYSSLKESLDAYLETWRKWNLEYIEAMHLLESSLMEGSESRRQELLDKSLDVILEETYEKMMHYAQNLKSPITTLHMLGVILPILGLVILPLAVNFLLDAQGNPIVKWYHIALLYNIVLPIGVYYMGRTILAQRPTGYGDTDISEDIPELSKYKKIIIRLGQKEILISPLYLCVILGILMLLLSLVPIMLHVSGFNNLGFGQENTATDCGRDYCFVTYKTDDYGIKTGPFDLASSIISILFPLSFAFSVGLYYRMKSKNLIKIREEVKSLEDEFASALFQLGNRLGDGLPAEVAFESTSRIMQDTAAGRFFRLVSANIQKLGMSVASAIFDPKVGAITSFPSRIIESSMKVLIQAIRKGPKIAAEALINISRYIKEMHRVTERLKDLLADVIVSMKSQISMITPIIAGIVVGLTSMITNILGKIGPVLQQRGTDDPSIADQIPQLFGNGIPTYYFQIIIGLYVVQIIYILTVLSNGIENGSDKLNEDYLIGRNLIRSSLIYSFISIIIMIVFKIIGDMVLQGLVT